MTIKCPECGNGKMTIYPMISSSKRIRGSGMHTEGYHTNIHLKIKGQEISFGTVSHRGDEVIVVCSNFPECNHYHVMKKSNLNDKLIKEKVGNINIKGYGKHHYVRN